MVFEKMVRGVIGSISRFEREGLKVQTLSDQPDFNTGIGLISKARVC